MAGAGKAIYVEILVQGVAFRLHEDEKMANVISFFKFNSEPFRFAQFKLVDNSTIWVKPSDVGVIYAVAA